MSRPAEGTSNVRWDFPDPADVEENRQRERVVGAMGRWWQTFAANTRNLEAAFRRTGVTFDVAGFTNAGLNPVAEGLCWENGRV
jgi:hypothetical protein